MTSGREKRTSSYNADGGNNVCFKSGTLVSAMLEMTYVEVENFRCWEVNDLLTKLFLQCNFEILLLAQSRFGAKVVVDISFHHYAKYPSLLFDGANMEIIHMLKADISIDAY